MDLSSWTTEHFNAAMREGWVLSDSEGSDNGPLQVQRIDDPQAWNEAGPPVDIPVLADDMAAWRVVGAGTMPHHEEARRLLGLYNPPELALVMAWASGSSFRLKAAQMVANNWRIRRRLPRITRYAQSLGFIPA